MQTAKKKGKDGRLSVNPACRRMTLREENKGKKPPNLSSMLKMEHLQNIATWARRGSSIPPLAALFGHHLSSHAEASGVALHHSFFFCKRCETILQPGDNCTIRIKRNSKKKRPHKGLQALSQNSIIYTCHFCLHRNPVRGTTKCHVKELLASRARQAPAAELRSIAVSKLNVSPGIESSILVNESRNVLVSPNPILESKWRSLGKKSTENRVPEKSNILLTKKWKEAECGCAPNGSRPSSATSKKGEVNSDSKKRKRKGWSSLKDVIESKENANKHISNILVIPFKL